eukprot:3520781-Rhodomonas_salina.1
MANTSYAAGAAHTWKLVPQYLSRQYCKAQMVPQYLSRQYCKAQLVPQYLSRQYCKAQLVPQYLSRGSSQYYLGSPGPGSQ